MSDAAEVFPSARRPLLILLCDVLWTWLRNLPLLVVVFGTPLLAAPILLVFIFDTWGFESHTELSPPFDAAKVVPPVIIATFGLLICVLFNILYVFVVVLLLRQKKRLDMSLIDAAILVLRRLHVIAVVGLLWLAAVLIGGLALVIPGALAAILLAFAVPAATVEGLGPFAALGRSIDLTHRNFIRCLAVSLLTGVISQYGSEMLDSFGEQQDTGVVFAVLLFLAQAAVLSIIPIALAVQYVDLSDQKPSAGPSQARRGDIPNPAA